MKLGPLSQADVEPLLWGWAWGSSEVVHTHCQERGLWPDLDRILTEAATSWHEKGVFSWWTELSYECDKLCPQYSVMSEPLLSGQVGKQLPAGLPGYLPWAQGAQLLSVRLSTPASCAKGAG